MTTLPRHEEAARKWLVDHPGTNSYSVHGGGSFADCYQADALASLLASTEAAGMERGARHVPPITFSDLWDAFLAGVAEGQRYPTVEARVFIGQAADAYVKLWQERRAAAIEAAAKEGE